MKKTLITIAILFVGTFLYSQEPSKVKSEPKDSITQKDVQKHVYLTGIDLYQYNLICYRDSIDIREFYGKPLNSEFWKTKGQYYWNPFEPLPQGVKYLHWLGTQRGYIDFLSQKYTPTQK
jgi:hypothetical protein